MLSRDPARSRPPTDRPLDVVGLELLVCVTQALLAGLLLSLASDLGGDTRAVGLPVPGLLALLGLAVGTGWIWWLAGGSGWPLAAVDLAIALLTGALWLLSLQDGSAPHLDPLTGLVAVSCAIYGIVAGVFLPGPRRGHWKGGVSQPRRGLPDTRTTPARFSPPVQKVVDERLANVSLPRVSMASVRLPRMQLPSRGSSDAAASAADGTLAPAPSTGPSAGPTAAGGATPVVPDTATPASGAAEPVPDTDVPTLIHRILTGDEPLSVSAMRLSGIPAAAADVPGDDPDDETLPFPTAAPEHPDGHDTAPANDPEESPDEDGPAISRDSS